MREEIKKVAAKTYQSLEFLQVRENGSVLPRNDVCFLRDRACMDGWHLFTD